MGWQQGDPSAGPFFPAPHQSFLPHPLSPLHHRPPSARPSLPVPRPQPCPRAVASASSSLSPPRTSSAPSNRTQTVRSSTSRKLARSLAPMSASFLSSLPPRPILFSARAYAARMSFYRLRQFQCEVTGKSGLDYFQAVESERQEARTLHARFSEPLKYPVLRAVQWRMSTHAPIPFCLLIFSQKRSWVASIISSKLSLNASKIAISRARVCPRPSSYPHRLTFTSRSPC